MASLKALGGTSDLLPEESQRWCELEEKARRLFTLYGFREVRTPLLEEADLFRQSLGAQAEIVQKQMYEFTDRGKRRIALRPEGTAPIVRAFIEKGLDTTAGITRWYYLGPMFRAERPQAGRRRQFHQMGVEVFGLGAPFQDAEVIRLLKDLLEQLGVEGFQLKVNSLGCRTDRSKIVGLIVKTFSPLKSKLCPDCKERLKRNPLRILDCKEKTCTSRRQAVDLTQAVCSGCREHFAQVLQGLQASGLRQDLDFRLDPSLVRGLDYYTKTTFEAIHPDLGAQNALGGGGRYDDLVESLGGQPTPAVGFAIGVERILMTLKEGEVGQKSSPGPSVFVAAIGDSCLKEGFRLVSQLRQAGVSSVADYEARPLRRQLEQANKLQVKLVAILGSSELARGVVQLKEMASGEQQEVPLSQCVEAIRGRLAHVF